MRNVTIALDDETYRKARIAAAHRDAVLVWRRNMLSLRSALIQGALPLACAAFAALPKR